MSKAFGEQNPTQGEDAVSWQTWSDGASGTPNVVGDLNWGKLSLQTAGAEGRSAVYDLSGTHTRQFTITENRYGTGTGTSTIEYRGSTGSFLQDDDYPDWEVYTAPVSKDYRYVQVRARTFDVFYVDATLGSDLYSGTYAAPWKTITKVNAITFSPGDQILFKRGETWTNERLLIGQSGEIGNPIVYGSYGTGALPIIDAGTANCSIRAFTGKHHITIQDIEVTGGVEPTNSCITMDSAYDITIQRVTASYGQHGGIAINGLYADTYNITISDCTIHHNIRYGGIYVGANHEGNGPHDVLIENNICYSNGTVLDSDHGIYVSEMNDCIIRNNHCYSNKSGGIKWNGDCSNILIEKNLLHDNQVGIWAFGPGTVTVRNNLIYDNSDMGLHIADADNCCFYHNTIVNNGIYGVYWYYAYNTIGATFKNNIVVQDYDLLGALKYPIAIEDSDTTRDNTFDHNIYHYSSSPDNDIAIMVYGGGQTLIEWQALTGTPDLNSSTSDPGFVTEYTNLHLQASLNGENVGVTDDYDDVVRANPPDIGAYEYV